MPTYIRSETISFGAVETSSPDIPSVQVDTIGDTIFAVYNYKDPSGGSSVSGVTWNGESFTQLADVPDLTGDPQLSMQVFYLTTATTGTFDILASNNNPEITVAACAVYSGVTSVAPIFTENAWYSAPDPALAVSGSGVFLNIFGPGNFGEGFLDYSSTTWSPANGQVVRDSIQNTTYNGGSWIIFADNTITTSGTFGWTPSVNQPTFKNMAVLIGAASSTVTATLTDYQYGDTVTVNTVGLGTVTSATLTDANSNVMTLTVDSTGTDTADLGIPAIAAALDGCLFGDGLTLTVSDGTDSPTTTVDLNDPTGYTRTDLTAVTGVPTWLSDELTTPLAIGDQILENSSRITIATDGDVTVTDGAAFSTQLMIVAYSGGEITLLDVSFTVSGGGKAITKTIVKNITKAITKRI